MVKLVLYAFFKDGQIRQFDHFFELVCTQCTKDYRNSTEQGSKLQGLYSRFFHKTIIFCGKTTPECYFCALGIVFIL